MRQATAQREQPERRLERHPPRPTHSLQDIDGQTYAPLHAEHTQEDHQVERRKRAARRRRREGLRHRRLAERDKCAGHTPRAHQAAPARGPSTTAPNSNSSAQRHARRNQPIDLPTTTCQTWHDDTPAEEGEQHRQIDCKQAARRAGCVVPGDVGKPRPSP